MPSIRVVPRSSLRPVFRDVSVQPVVQEDKTGIFTELGYFLEKKLEGRQELEKI